MMGRLETGQEQFFYSYRLDELVPADHLVRKLDAVLDLGWVRGELSAYYSHTGRPSIDPALMLRMLIVGYVFAIRSERQLCAKFRSTWRIAGSADCRSRVLSPIIRRSLVRDMSAFGKPMFCVASSSVWSTTV